MDEDEMLRALAAKYPRLKRSIAEYAGDGRAAIEAYIREHPVEALIVMRHLEALKRGELI